ncbi:GTP-binding protein [Alkalibacter mobilis]|uniref:GTP-binding protein n=1 Tax=Alkalibacter mobilis TaxID=2787712 RepID=UPI00189E5167|nr:GTP-binding protein [Alkalibacter mobilis]MBF7097250.1 cobalamin biosynthesis protein P47K [Alkalibacter mobilis]
MKCIIIATGFLGSGKTTFLKELIEYTLKRNAKIALIVNEIGEIGIDNQYMKQLGFNVWELFGGCVCCTLAAGLENAINQLENDYNPDMIFIEPSGMADPQSALNAISNYGVDRNEIKNYFVFDISRFDMFEEVIFPLIITSIKQADFVLLNKLQYADEKTKKKAYELIKINNPNVEIIEIVTPNLVNQQVKKTLEGLI